MATLGDRGGVFPHQLFDLRRRVCLRCPADGLDQLGLFLGRRHFQLREHVVQRRDAIGQLILLVGKSSRVVSAGVFRVAPRSRLPPSSRSALASAWAKSRCRANRSVSSCASGHRPGAPPTRAGVRQCGLLVRPGLYGPPQSIGLMIGPTKTRRSAGRWPARRARGPAARAGGAARLPWPRLSAPRQGRAETVLVPSSFLRTQSLPRLLWLGRRFLRIRGCLLVRRRVEHCTASPQCLDLF